MPAQNASKKPGQNTPSTARSVKSAWKKSRRFVSLKQWARELRVNNAPSGNERVQNVLAWLLNKKANTSKPNQGIGRTNRGGKGKK